MKIRMERADRGWGGWAPEGASSQRESFSLRDNPCLHASLPASSLIQAPSLQQEKLRSVLGSLGRAMQEDKDQCSPVGGGGVWKMAPCLLPGLFRKRCTMLLPLPSLKRRTEINSFSNEPVIKENCNALPLRNSFLIKGRGCS